METDLVSTIITTHNRVELLKRAIDSVFKQTYTNIECIVVDDASDDGTDLYCRNLKDVTYIRIEKTESKGGNYARNLGIKASKGKFVAFLDDDDYWLPSKIERQHDLIKKRNIGVVHCGVRYELLSDNGVKYKDSCPNFDHIGDISKKILMINTTMTSCLFVKRQVLFDVGLFDENLKCCQEYELTIRLAQVSFFDFVADPLIVYRVDKKDTKRITNKYYIWKESVKYIYAKHKGLYFKMSFFQFVFFVLRCFYDCSDRCYRTGLKRGYIYKPVSILLFYPILIFLRINNKIRK